MINRATRVIQKTNTISLRHVQSVIKSPWRGRYAAITRAGDSLLLHISTSTTYSIKQLSIRTKLGQSILEAE